MADYTNINKNRIRSISDGRTISFLRLESNEISEGDLNLIYNEVIKMISEIKNAGNK